MMESFYYHIDTQISNFTLNLVTSSLVFIVPFHKSSTYPFHLTMTDLRELTKTLQSLPPSHPAKLSMASWPCGSHTVTSLTYINGPQSMRELIEYCFKKNGVQGNEEFLKYKDEVLTYDESWQQINELGSALVHDYGVQAGDRVAISMRNYPEWPIAFLAITCIGGVVCPLNR